MKRIMMIVTIMVMVLALVACSSPNNMGNIYEMIRRDFESMIVIDVASENDEVMTASDSNMAEDALSYILTMRPDETSELTKNSVDLEGDLMYVMTVEFVDRTLHFEVGKNFFIVKDENKDEIGFHIIDVEDVYKLEGYLDRVILN